MNSITNVCEVCYCIFYYKHISSFIKKASSCNVKYSTKDFRTRQNKNISAHKIYDIGSDNFFNYFTMRHGGFL